MSTTFDLVVVFEATGVVEKELIAHMEQSSLRATSKIGYYSTKGKTLSEVNGWAPVKLTECDVKGTRSIINLVPSMSQQLVAACAKHGTHYFDSSSNIVEIRGNITNHDAVAKASGAAIVQMITSTTTPADLAINNLREGIGSEGSIKSVTDSHLPTPSVNSVRDVFNQLRGKSRSEFIAASSDEMYLSGQCERAKDRVVLESKPAMCFDQKTKKWQTPVQGAHLALLSANQSSCLQRNATSGLVKYHSVVEHFSVVKAAAFVALVIVITLGMLIPYGHKILPAVLPLYLKVVSPSGVRTVFSASSGRRVVFTSSRSPQQITAVLLCETALFALDKSARGEQISGCQTPSSIGGNDLMQHLRACGRGRVIDFCHE
eukprot:TRINITY_DN10678_c0_g1_i1.p1 TRINITY_DN10678_c0_g1~~TRINITY_DN10678_c0_g1_i1.p1  ORF type:complete len:389 (+),score=55.62 TRINITY_DN10678_c0_g1_i1:43-1167(+)